MPVLESTEFTTPRSALRHRPIGDEGAKPGKPTTNAPIPPVQRASRTRSTDTQVEIDEWQREADNASTNTQGRPSVRRTSAPAGSKTRPQKPTGTQSLSKAKQAMKRRAHPLFYLGLGMLSMLILWTVAMAAANWFGTTMDDIRFGRPRTFQTDQYVGHNETAGMPSHFIAINLNGRVEVIEFPGGDAAHARIFLGPQLYTSGSELVPVTLTFMDVNGDHKLDMIINVQGSQVVFINDQGAFRPLRPDERSRVEQFLQHHRP